MAKPRETSVGAYDAKTHFSELLERVVKGEEVTITRHGAPVARMVPIHRKTNREQRRAAIEAMREVGARQQPRRPSDPRLDSGGRR